MGGVSVGTGCPSGGALGNWGPQAWEVEAGMVAPLLTQASRSPAPTPNAQAAGLVSARSAAAAKSLRSCATPGDFMDLSPPGSSVHEDSLDKNTGVGCPALLQGIFPDPGIKPASLMSPVLAGRFFTTSATWEEARRARDPSPTLTALRLDGLALSQQDWVPASPPSKATEGLWWRQWGLGQAPP